MTGQSLPVTALAGGARGVGADAGVELRPVMTLRAQLVLRKRVPAGTGVSYGYRWRAPEETARRPPPPSTPC